MGVVHLWDILSPVGEKGMRISQLSGKTLAVDLSMWILEFSKCEGTQKLRNLYIRNLFYRSLEFMKDGVNLIFVLDGLAPELKHETLKKRREKITSGLNLDGNSSTRPHLERYSNECVTLIECLGVPWMSSPGEAEEMCAYLNYKGLVDGCITRDSDFFCYGGQTIYRNLRKESKLYVVDKVEMEKVKSILDLQRSDLVVMALLLGCDYNGGGVKNVGKDKAVSLIKVWKERGIDSLNRIMGWHGNKELDVVEQKMSAREHKESHCKKCNHTGTTKIHEKSGCQLCDTQTGCKESCDILCTCDWCREGQLIKDHKLEVTIRQKSRENPAFMERSKKVVDEYIKSDFDLDIDKDNIVWKPIDLEALVGYLDNRLYMQEAKVIETVTPVFVFSQLYQEGECLMYSPVRIERQCKHCGVEGYLVSWDKTDRNTWPMPNSIEVKMERTLFSKKFPHLVKQFEERDSAKAAPGKRKRKLVEASGSVTPRKKRSENTISTAIKQTTKQTSLTAFMTNTKRQLDLNKGVSKHEDNFTLVEHSQADPFNVEKVCSISDTDELKDLPTMDDCADSGIEHSQHDPFKVEKVGSISDSDDLKNVQTIRDCSDSGIDYTQLEEEIGLIEEEETMEKKEEEESRLDQSDQKRDSFREKVIGRYFAMRESFGKGTSAGPSGEQISD